MRHIKSFLNRCLGWCPLYQAALGGYKYYQHILERTPTKAKFFYLGHNARIAEEVLIIAPERCYIGDNAGIGPRCFVNAVGGFRIGCHSVMGAECYVLTWEHRFRDGKQLPYDEVRKVRPVTIGDYVWIGARVMIRAGVKIGDGAVVGIGSVVTRDVAPLTIVAGNPAKPVGERCAEVFRELRSKACGRDPSAQCDILWVSAEMEAKYGALLQEFGFNTVPGERYFRYEKGKGSLVRIADSAIETQQAWGANGPGA